MNGSGMPIARRGPNRQYLPVRIFFCRPSRQGRIHFPYTRYSENGCISHNPWVKSAIMVVDGFFESGLTSECRTGRFEDRRPAIKPVNGVWPGKGRQRGPVSQIDSTVTHVPGPWLSGRVYSHARGAVANETAKTVGGRCESIKVLGPLSGSALGTPDRVGTEAIAWLYGALCTR
jgi:hypothetical protein